jgi:hypothetical protein
MIKLVEVDVKIAWQSLGVALTDSESLQGVLFSLSGSRDKYRINVFTRYLLGETFQASALLPQALAGGQVTRERARSITNSTTRSRGP